MLSLHDKYNTAFYHNLKYHHYKLKFSLKLSDNINPLKNNGWFLLMWEVAVKCHLRIYLPIKGLYKNTIIQLQLKNINRKHPHMQQDTPAIMEYYQWVLQVKLVKL